MEEVVAPVEGCAWDPSGKSMEAYCNQRMVGSMQTQMSTVMDGVAVLEEKRKELPLSGSETTGKMACTSSAVSVVAGGQRVHVVEDQSWSTKDQNSMRDVAVVAAAAVAEGSHTSRTARVA